MNLAAARVLLRTRRRPLTDEWSSSMSELSPGGKDGGKGEAPSGREMDGRLCCFGLSVLWSCKAQVMSKNIVSRGRTHLIDRLNDPSTSTSVFHRNPARQHQLRRQELARNGPLFALVVFLPC